MTLRHVLKTTDRRLLTLSILTLCMLVATAFVHVPTTRACDGYGNGDCDYPGGPSGGDDSIDLFLTATPSTINQGDPSQLSWWQTNPHGSTLSPCSVDNGIGSVNWSDSTTVRPSVTTTYTYTCANRSASATVTVNPPQSCTSAPNSCGSTTSGSVVNGSCDAVTPANPAGYGNTCSSSPNACGTTGSGTIACNGVCTATPPSNPANYGNSCTSAANSCGQTSTGSISCTGACSATTPSDATCPVNGSCSATHYSCTSGTSANNVNGTTSYTWSCTGTNGGSTASCSEAKALSDLIASGITPVSATAGTAVTLSGTVTNQGAASTGSSFPNYIITRTGSQGSGSDVFDPNVTLPALNPSGTGTVSGSYTFPSAGLYSAILCADVPPWDVGTIPESNENNNCGPWTDINVSAPPPVTPPGISCSPNPNLGDNTTLITYSQTHSGFSGTPSYSWTDANASPGSGSGSTYAVHYATNGSYAAHVSATSGGQSASADCSPVNIAGACGASPSPTITASPTRVASGSSTRVAWSATGVNTSCVVTGPSVNTTSPASSCNVTNGSANPTITTQSTYCIVCDGNQATKKCATVDVAPKIIEF